MAHVNAPPGAAPEQALGATPGPARGRTPAATHLRRRSLLLGVVAAPALLWAAGPARAEDGLAAQLSPNGWPVGDPATSIGVRTLAVAGTAVRLPVSDTAAGAVLLHVARRFHREVEPLGAGCWGYSYRANVNSPGVWSNHASGTAIDLNAPRHPNGAAGTFTSDQVRAIRSILEECRGTVRWGGDYSRTKDEMHFELDVAPGHKTLAAVVAGLDGEDEPVRNLILAKQSTAPEVWLGDGMLRRRVEDVTELANVQYWMKLKGGDPTVHTIDDLRVLGVVM